MLLVLGSSSALAATIPVTTRTDVVADDGRCSLREAVGAANGNRASGGAPGECVAGDPVPVVDVIELRRGKYKLALGGPADDANAGGDLDVTESVVIAGKGRRKTMIKSVIGDPLTPGDGDRLAHVDPSAVGGVDVTLRDLTLTKGDVGCSGEDCETGASAVLAAGAGALRLERCGVTKNAVTCSGKACGDGFDGGAIGATGGGALEIRGSAIEKNRARCDDDGCVSGFAAIVMVPDEGLEPPRFVLEETTLAKNATECTGATCTASPVIVVEAGPVVVRDVVLVQNSTTCSSVGCSSGDVARVRAQAPLSWEGTLASENTVRCVGDSCLAGLVLDLRTFAGGSVFDAAARDNDNTCEGTGCTVFDHVAIGAFDSELDIDGLAVSAGEVSCSGDSCDADTLLELFADDDLTVRNVAVETSVAACQGGGCEAAHIVRLNGGRAITVEHGNVSDNTVACSGDGCRLGSTLAVFAEGDVGLRHVEVVDSVNACTGLGCRMDDVVLLFSSGGATTVESGDFSRNLASCAEAECATESILEVSVPTDVVLDDVATSGNQTSCAGDECAVGEIVRLEGTRAIDAAFWSVAGNRVACFGGGCQAQETVELGRGAAALRSATLRDNTCRCDGVGCRVGLGGALHNAASVLTVEDSTFAGNQTDGFGAAVFNDPSAELVLDRVTMLENAAGARGTTGVGSGGAIYNDALDGERGVLRMTDTEIRDNSAEFAGGGILNEGTIAVIVNSTIADNEPTDCTDFAGGTGCP
jgi:hypothetical protein